MEVRPLSTGVAAPTDRFGNPVVDGLPYARGEILRTTADDHVKHQRAGAIVEERHRAGRLYNFTGLERSLVPGDADPALFDDELAAAYYGERLRRLALEHLGGKPDRDDVLVTNRLTAAIFVAMQTLVQPESTVFGVSPGYSHPAVVRAVRFAGGRLTETRGADELAVQLAAARVPALVVLTRLPVTYEPLGSGELDAIMAAARRRHAVIFADEAGGARVGPAVLGQPRTLELGVDAGATGLDKYGTFGPRLGLLAGRRELVAEMRVRALELGMEARPLLYPAVVHSLARYRPERVRELVAATEVVCEAVRARLGELVTRTPVAFRLEGEDILAEAMSRGGLSTPPIVPVEATAALAMLLLRDHGILTVHFAALPPGTAALLVKFIPPETLERLGGPDVFAHAVESSLDTLGRLVADPSRVRELLLGER
jgi:L-seryl-tRNA(Ser) seleniumtransferase